MMRGRTQIPKTKQKIYYIRVMQTSMHGSCMHMAWQCMKIDYITSSMDNATLAQLGERQTEVYSVIYLKALCSIHKSRIMLFFFCFSHTQQLH